MKNMLLRSYPFTFFAKIAGLLYCFLFLFFQMHAQKISVILDSDTGNEVDDPYALALALLEPSWDVLALNATHWQTSHWAIDQTMENSHRLNQFLLGHMNMKVPTKRGGIARMYDWGDQAQHSAATYEIIKQAKKASPENKLTVVALGALTNVASAIYIDPSIQDKIKLYWLGSTYDFEDGVLGTTDFNCMMDTYALHHLFQSSVEMHIMPLGVAVKMSFSLPETLKRLQGKHSLGDFLCDRWKQHLDGSRWNRAIWDLALVSAVIHPQWAEEEVITTSKDFGQREIAYYKYINVEKMKEDFYEKVVEFKP